MFLLVSLSVAGLFAGAALVAVGRLRAEATSMMDGLALGMLPALVLARLLPHAYESLGLGALALAALGFASVTAAHRGGAQIEEKLGRALVFPALALHALSDGAALAMSTSGRVGESGMLLAAITILHRVPEGLFVANTRAGAGPSALLRAVTPLALTTVLGAVLGESMFEWLPDRAVDGVLAVGAGAMLRLVTHAHEQPSPQPRAANGLAGMAFLVGVALVLALPTPDDVLRRAQPREFSVAASALPLFIEIAPAVLLGLACTGALHVFGRGWVPDWLRGGAFRSAARGLLFGLPLPVNACGQLPMAQHLLALGVTAAGVLAFAVATPELGLNSALLSVRLLGTTATAARIAGSIVLGLGVAWIGAALARAPAGAAAHSCTAERAPLQARGLGAWLQESFVSMLDHTGAWLVFGLLAAAALEAALDPALLGQLGAPWDVLIASLLALPVYVCAQGATPVAAVLLHKGASLGAVLALLWVGPATNVALIALLRRSLGARAALGFAAGSVLLASLLGLLANRWVSRAGVPEVHPLVEHVHAPWEWATAALLALLLIASLLRSGPRAWLAALSADPHAHFDHTATSPPPAAAHAHAHAAHAHHH